MYARVWLFHVAELTVFIYIHGPAIVLQSARPKSQNANRKCLKRERTVPVAFQGEIARLRKAEVRYRATARFLE